MRGDDKGQHEVAMVEPVDSPSAARPPAAEGLSSDPRRYDPTFYEGAAQHYLAGRPPYSRELEAALGRAVALDRTGTLLDVGCGPGVLAVRLAPLFQEVVALDPDAGMLAEGRKFAAERGIDGIRWVQALAEDLPEAAPGPYRLATFGQSFHWTDQTRTADTVYDLLEPGGAIAVLRHTGHERPRLASPGPPPIPHQELRALVERYLGSASRAGQRSARPASRLSYDVLAESRFGPPDVVVAPGVPDVIRDVEDVLAGYLSFSYAAPHLFGERIHDFARDVRELLRSRSPDGRFWDWPGDTEILIGRRAGG